MMLMIPKGPDICKVNGKSIGTLDNFNNDILVLDAGRNDIELTKGDITRKESFGKD